MMKYLLVFSLVALCAGTAQAKPNYTKEVGLKCAECHVKGMKGKSEENRKSCPLFAKALEMNQKMSVADSDPRKDPAFRGRKSCHDCHSGTSKPRK